ncbi:MAG: DNA polymerase III subunit alpha [Acidobacteria bacterium]|nr:MAG: DNA polymerase III subunit alpha [Acidobacteriota bacterium]
MFLELHAASAFSFLRGASLPEELVERAAALEMPVLGLIDGDGFYGAPRFHLACRRAGVRPLFGAEITLEDGARLPVLAASRAGYRSLCRLLSRMHLRGAAPGVGRMQYSELAELEEVIALSGDEEGPLAWTLRAGGTDAARERLEQLASAFGSGNLYVELQRHYLREQEERNRAAIGLARALKLPLVATNGVRYATPAARPVLDVFTCLRLHTRLESAGRKLEPNAQRFLAAPAMVERRFRDLPEALAHTAEIAARCTFTLDDLGYEFPQPPVPEGHTPQSWLREQTWRGARRRYGALRAEVRAQLEHELEIIGKLKLAGYFLILDGIMDYCRAHGILAQGRGSAANSAVCYSLGITAVDPIGMQLLFERFLSEERGEWPDIDLDLPSGELREQVIQYVYGRYGQGTASAAAMTANVITYRPRSAAREAAKVMDFPEAVQAKLAQILSAAGGVLDLPSWQETLQQRGRAARFPPAAADVAPAVAAGLRQAGFDPEHPQMLRFLYVCQAMQDLPRHLGQHSGGMVLCAGPLSEIVPLQPAAMPKRVVIQWDKEDCAALGLIKVDLLGLGMMAVLQDTLVSVRDRLPRAVGSAATADLDWLPPEDADVYRTLRAADTVGLFQVESRAQMATLPRMQPRRFYDLVIEVAIIRPGPITGDLVNPYLRRRAGEEEVRVPHPLLEPILRRTLGVPLFQEQLLKMAMTVAGFTGGQAEELRRAMGFKRSQQRMAEIERQLRAGMSERGIDAAAADEIIRSITSFALYGFPESHAASFALLVYASAYLKQYFPEEFLAAMLNHQPMGFYHPATLVRDAQRHGVVVLPVSVAASEWDCTAGRLARGRAGRAVRLGLRYVNGLRESVGRQIAEERRARAFTSFEDLCRRVALNAEEARRLGELGACKAFGALTGAGPGVAAPHHPLDARPGRGPREPQPGLRATRRTALWQIEAAQRAPGSLYAPLPEPGMEPDAISPLPEMDTRERMEADFAASGLTLGPHPLAFERTRLRQQGYVTAAELAGLRHQQKVAIAGAVIARQRPENAKGVVFLSLEDETGISNIIIWPQVYERYRLECLGAAHLEIHGRLQRQRGVIHVLAETLAPLHTGAALLPASPARDFR